MRKGEARTPMFGSGLPVLYRMPPEWAYPFAVGLTLVVVGLRGLLDMFGDGIVPFGLFFPVILASTLLGGRGPGLLALALALLAAAILWMDLRGESAVRSVTIINGMIFVGSAGAVLLVADRLRSALHRTRQSEHRLALAQRAGLIGMWDVDLRSGQTRWSDLLYEITGINRDVVPGVEAFAARIHSDDRDRAMAAFEDASRGVQDVDTEFRFLTDDGRTLVLVSRAEVIRDAKGQPKRLIGVNVDVTSLRGAEQERDRATNLLQLFFDTLPGAAYAKDTEGRTLMGNPLYAAAVGHGPEHFLGKTDLDMQPDKDLARMVMENDSRVMREGITQEIEEDLVLPDGRMSHWLSIKTPFVDTDGRLLGIIGVSLDVTERRRAEERLRLLAHEVDHRAKNLLGVVQSVVRLTEVKDVAAFKVAVTGRIQALARAHSLLAASRWQGVTINRLVEEELTPFTAGQPDRVAASGAALLLRPGAAQAIGMVLHELSTNAAKYGALSAAAGRVSLSWRVLPGEQGGCFELVWAESGGPAVEAPTRAGFGSTVIGGSIQQQLGGEVTFDWSPSGLVCRILLPLDRLDANSPFRNTETDARLSAPVPLEGKRVLIVEDEALIAMTLADVIAELGCELAGTAATPEDGLAMLRQGNIDLAILDWNLAGQSSKRVAAALQALAIPFVYCTGYSDPVGDTLEGGAEAEVVSKPASAETLGAALRRAMSGSPNDTLEPA
jgi:PAS domain S-box-containing protein